MRASLLWILVAAALAASPLMAYEAVEKAAEVAGVGGSVPTLSVRCDHDIPWRARSGRAVVDRTLHEMEEARLFYRLLWRRLQRRLA